MASKNSHQRTCAVCGKSFSEHNVVSGEIIRTEIADEIRKAVPDWSPYKFICKPDLDGFRGKYINAILESEKGEVSSLEQEVLDSMKEHELLSSNIETEFERNWTFGERMADKLAAFGGSWAFLILFAIFLFIWMAMNSVVLVWHPLDPYPYIFLNLILSCLAAIQAPIIMMSQNRQ